MRNLKTTANATYDIRYYDCWVSEFICRFKSIYSNDDALAIGDGGVVVTGPTTSTGVYKAPNGSAASTGL